MLDPSVQLASFIKGGQGGGHHLPAQRTLTPDGQRLVAWAKTLPKDQAAAVVHAFNRQGIQVTDVMTTEDYNHTFGGNNPPRYDQHTGTYYTSESGSEVATVICGDPTLLVEKHHK